MTDEELHRPLVGRPGSRQALNTPALILDLAALKANITRMAEFAAACGLALRPHVKTHKSPHIARLQIEAGAVGLCCAKIGEAEVMAEHGLTNGLHLTSPVTSPPALQRLAEIQPELPAWHQDTIDQMLASAKALAADTNSAILNQNDAGAVPMSLNEEYKELVAGIDRHAETLVKTSDAAGDYAVAHRQAVEAGLKVPRH